MDLYGTLGLSADAPPEEVRRAYRRSAAQLHPDKGGTSPSRFAAVTEAYEILSDQHRREVYDAFGMDGLKLYEGFQTLSRAAGVSGTAPPPAILVMTAAVAVPLSALLLAVFLILVTLKYDGRSPFDALPWPVAMLPAALATPLLGAIAALLSADGSVRAALPSVTLLLAFLLLLSARLELEDREDVDAYARAYDAPDSPLSWLAVFAPLYVGRGLRLAALPASLRARLRDAASRSKGSGEYGGRQKGAMDSPLGATLRELAWLLLSTLWLSLLPPKLEGLLRVRWKVLVSPLMLGLALEAGATLWACCRVDRTNRADGMLAPRPSPSLRPFDRPEPGSTPDEALAAIRPSPLASPLASPMARPEAQARPTRLCARWCSSRAGSLGCSRSAPARSCSAGAPAPSTPPRADAAPRPN